jgi:hypothetical protein
MIPAKAQSGRIDCLQQSSPISFKHRQVYKMDAEAIALKVKQEFAAKEKAKIESKVKPKSATKALKKTA